MRLGLIARCSNTGLGVQTHAFYRNMKPDKTLLVNCGMERPVDTYPDRYPDAQVVSWPTVPDVVNFLDGLDVVFTAESPYTPALYVEADRLGVKTVNQLNYELLERTGPKASLYAAPSMWHYNDIPFDNKTFLPVPVELDRFTFQESSEARRFLCVVGRPAIHDRNGVNDLLASLRYVTQDVEVTLKCQDKAYAAQLCASASPSMNVKLTVAGDDVKDYWRLYEGYDVLVLPRRYGGLCLPINEALAAGMPVITTDISPNNVWLPQRWLVPATLDGHFQAKTRIDLYTVNHQALAGKIDEFASSPVVFKEAQLQAQALAESLSWENLRPLYVETFEKLMEVTGG